MEWMNGTLLAVSYGSVSLPQSSEVDKQLKKNNKNNLDRDIRRQVNEIKRFIISNMINDLILETKNNLYNTSSAKCDSLSHLIVSNDLYQSKLTDLR